MAQVSLHLSCKRRWWTPAAIYLIVFGCFVTRRATAPAWVYRFVGRYGWKMTAATVAK